MPPDKFAKRVDLWGERTHGTSFRVLDYSEAFKLTRPNDLVYCDPPYTHSQAILYGAQSFSLTTLFDSIAEAKRRGVFVALSIDGTKKTGDMICDLPIPKDLFVREVMVNRGRSMLKRFQMSGQSLEHEVVQDRLLLTY